MSAPRRGATLALTLALAFSATATALAVPQAELIEDINRGARNSGPEGLTRLGNNLLFRAGRVGSGSELWSTDGTRPCTTLVTDLNAGGQGSNPGDFVQLGQRLYFGAIRGANAGLFSTDGAAAGTKLVKTFRSVGEIARLGQRLIFSAEEGIDRGVELWTTDGTASGTRLLKDINPGDVTDRMPAGSHPLGFTRLGKKLYFEASTNAGGDELWATDGTAAGTTLVKDINPGPAGSVPVQLTPLLDKLYFRATTGAGNRELWATDGSTAGTALVEDIIPGPAASDPGGFTQLGSSLYFSADTPGGGRELWATDATASAAGTTFVKDINAGIAESDPLGFARLGGTLYFTASTAMNGRELWGTDGTPAGTALVSDIFPGGAGSEPSGLTSLGGRLYFQATLASQFTGGAPGFGEESRLWSSDGRPAGTAVVAGFKPGFGESFPSGFTPLGSRLYFSAATRKQGRELWSVGEGLPSRGPARPAPALSRVALAGATRGPTLRIGFRVRGACRATVKIEREARGSRRRTTVRSLEISPRSGRNSISTRRPTRPGRYRLTTTATAHGGRKARTVKRYRIR